MRRQLQGRIGRIVLSAWFVAMLAVGTTLLARHAVALPRPIEDASFAQAMASMRSPAESGRWMAVHVLYAECQCSQRIADHLVASDRPSGVAEHVLLVGRSTGLEGRLTARGFPVTLTNAAELSGRYHVASVPLFVVVAPDDTVRYAGGYTTRKQGPDPRDLDILADVRADRFFARLPVFGCAVSARLQATLNPLGLP
jgi:hypothetical protein